MAIIYDLRCPKCGNDDLEKQRALSLKLIESENWELIEVKDRQ